MGGFGILIPAPIRFLKGSQKESLLTPIGQCLRDIEFNRGLKQYTTMSNRAVCLSGIEFNRGLKHQTHQTEDVPPRLIKYITSYEFCHGVAVKG